MESSNSASHPLTQLIRVGIKNCLNIKRRYKKRERCQKSWKQKSVVIVYGHELYGLVSGGCAHAGGRHV